MIRKLLREFFLLPRGEQRAMLLVSLFLLLSLAGRILVGALPGKELPGTEEFLQEARAVMDLLAEADSLENRIRDSIAASRDTQYPVAYVRSWREPLLLPGSINLNSVDSAGLLPLPGIGPVFAGRIIKYRNLLGGYYNARQLSEVYGITDERADQIEHFLHIDTARIRKLNLNTTAFRDLLRHPYLEYEDVKAIVKYRELMGPVTSIEALGNNMVFPDSVLFKIAPYLYLKD